ncbi:MAG: nuclear transport factor 2 family protein [Bryobacteraceae bacterium]
MRTLLLLSALSATFLSISAADVDRDGALRAVNYYVEGDLAGQRQVFLPSANLYFPNDKGELQILPSPEFLDRVAKSTGPKAKRKLISLDVVGRLANAKISAPGANGATVTDYLSLLKLADGWKIVAKTFSVEKP